MKIFVCDDEREIRKSLRAILEDEDYEVEDFATGKALLKTLSKERPDLILLDVWIGKEDGLVLLDECRKIYSTIPIVMISGHGTIELAVNATKKGAVDFLEKPLSIEKVLATIQQVTNRTQPEEVNYHLEYDEILGNSPGIRQVKFAISQAASTNARVFIYGENGTGKELVAKAIFKNSKRKDQSFVDINCAAIPEELIESELFGHEKGAFTGAIDKKKGRFELAHNGTLFLDEICDMSLSTQAKVLRALQEQKFERVGGSETIQVDVRIIAATNIPVLDAIKEGRFREDLYYRLNVIPIDLPPLRERREDIPILVEYYLKKSVEENHLKPKVLDNEALLTLQSHFWPGNIRELKNIVERLSIMIPDDVIKVSHVKEALVGFKKANEMVAKGDLKSAKEEFERQYITKALLTSEGNVTKASKALGIERTHLYRKIKQLNIQVDATE